MIKIIEDFITEQEHQDILSKIRISRVTIGTQRNRIIRYGSSLPYKSHVKENVIPSHFQFLLDKLVKEGIFPTQPDSLTINEYKEKQSIDWHIDSATSGPSIVVLSLLSPATMGMKNGNVIKDYLLPPRSLIVMTGEEREKWKHCIYPVSSTRLSIVFRQGTNVKK